MPRWINPDTLERQLTLADLRALAVRAHRAITDPAACSTTAPLLDELTELIALVDDVAMTDGRLELT